MNVQCWDQIKFKKKNRNGNLIFKVLVFIWNTKKLKRKLKVRNEQIVTNSGAIWRPRLKTKTDNTSKYPGANSWGEFPVIGYVRQ